MWWRRVVNNWQQRNTRATDSSGEHPLRTRLRSYSIASAGDDDISQFPPVPTSSVSRSPIGLVAVYATIIGIIVGAFIAGVAQLILFTERLVYGSDHQHEISPLDSLGPTINLLIHLVAVGFISGVGWAVLHWRSTRRVSIPQAMQGTTMPVGSTLSSSLLQIISVSAGVPIGREQAPRQIGALIASAFSRLWEVDRRTLRLLVASADGAGMAASFHLPLAGALFTIELLLVSASVRAVVTTMTCSVVATTVSGLLGAPRVTYNAAQLNESALTLLCAIVVGSIAGLAGDYFARLAHRASARPVSARWQWLATTGVMAIVGVLSLFFLDSSGNGAYSANLALTARVTLGGTIAVFVIRLAVTCASFWAGAVGGILTPSFALGALLGCGGNGCSPASTRVRAHCWERPHSSRRRWPPRYLGWSQPSSSPIRVPTVTSRCSSLSLLQHSLSAPPRRARIGYSGARSHPIRPASPLLSMVRLPTICGRKRLLGRPEALTPQSRAGIGLKR